MRFQTLRESLSIFRMLVLLLPLSFGTHLFVDFRFVIISISVVLFAATISEPNRVVR